jgi:hypothetical protein
MAFLFGDDVSPIKWLLEFIYGMPDTDWRGCPKHAICPRCGSEIPIVRVLVGKQWTLEDRFREHDQWHCPALRTILDDLADI